MSSGPESPVPDSVPAGGLGVVPDLFSSPTRAFRRLAADPKWIGTALFVVLLFGAATWIRLPLDLEYSREMAERVMDKLGLPAEEAEAAIAEMPRASDMTLGGKLFQVLQSLVGVSIFAFIASGIFHLFGRLSGASPTFRQTAAVFWLSNVAAGLGGLALAVLAWASGTVEVSLSPAALVPGLGFNSLPGIFLDLFDVSSLVVLFLLATGVREVFHVSSSTGWKVGGGFWIFGSLMIFSLRAVGAWFSGTL